jgi:TetR/AcrR family fatty acid metabolism transcriptional regulator
VGGQAVPRNAKVDGQPKERELERRRTILRAAIEVFAKKGYHGCRIADVAREAGVAYGLVYHYFKNKEELLASVFDAAWGNFVGRLVEVAGGPGTLAEKVRGTARVAFEAYQKDPRAVRVLILEIARSPAGAQVDRGSAFGEVIGLAEGMFVGAQQQGELRADLEPRLCAAMLFGAIEMGLTSLVVGLFDKKDEQVILRVQHQMAEIFLGGVLPAGNQEGRWTHAKSATSSGAPQPS